MNLLKKKRQKHTNNGRLWDTTSSTKHIKWTKISKDTVGIIGKVHPI